VCYKPLTGIQQVPENLRDEVYVPGKEETNSFEPDESVVIEFPNDGQGELK
jgi:hypothetical protein